MLIKSDHVLTCRFSPAGAELYQEMPRPFNTVTPGVSDNRPGY
jgi:hypothetical protein